jgi:hypothetical protein
MKIVHFLPVVKKEDGTILHLWFYCTVDVDVNVYKFSSHDLYICELCCYQIS